MQFFLGNLAPLQENWNPHQTVGYLAPPAKNPKIFGTPLPKILGYLAPPLPKILGYLAPPCQKS